MTAFVFRRGAKRQARSPRVQKTSGTHSQSGGFRLQARKATFTHLLVSSPEVTTEQPPAPSTGSAMHVLVLGLTVLLGLAISLAAFVLVRNWEQERVQRAFEAQARKLAQNLAVTLENFEETLYTLRDVFSASQDVNFGEFRTAASDLRARRPGIQTLEWLRKISRDERAGLESRAREEVYREFEIRDGPLAPTGDIASSELHRAEERVEYLALLYVEPLFPGQETIFGFDHFVGPFQRAIARARDSGMIAATRRVSVGGAPGWMMILPVYGPGPMPQTIEERRAKFRGCLLGSFRLNDLVTTTIDLAERQSMEVLLVDHTPASTEPFLIHFSGETVRLAAPPSEAEFRVQQHLAVRLPMAGREWFVLFRPAPAWLAAQTTAYSHAFFVGGLVLTGLVVSVLRSAKQRAAEVRETVARRTAELHATQIALREDIRERAAAERALRASDERYRAFITNSTEAIWRFEYDPPVPIDQPLDDLVEQIFHCARLAECNDALARMYGYQHAAELVGVRLDEIMPRSAEATMEHVRSLVRSGFRLENAETRELDRHGQTRIFLNNIIGIVEDGRLQRSWGTQRDVTREHERAEEKAHMEKKLQETQKLESLGVLAGGIAHDFNNLLTGVLGNASLARMDLPPDSPVASQPRGDRNRRPARRGTLQADARLLRARAASSCSAST